VGRRAGVQEPTDRSLRATVSDRRLLRRAARLFRPYRRQVLIVTLAILLTAGLGVASPLLVKVVFDRALFVPGGPRIGLLAALVGSMIAIPVVSSLVGVYQTYLTNSVGQRVMRDLRATLYTHLQSMSLRFFTGTRTGEIQSRLANDVGGLQTVITDTASNVLSNVVILLSTLVAMVVLSWQLTVLSLFLLPLFAYLTRRVGQARRQVTAQTQGALAEMSAITEETLSVSGVLLAKVFGRQRAETERYADQNERLATLQVRQQMIGRSFFALVSTFFSITPALVYLVAGLTYRNGGQLSPGTLVAFTTLQARLFFPIGQVLQISTEVTSSLALFARIFDYLDLHPDIVDRPDARAVPPSRVHGEVRLDHVWFAYEPGAAGDGDRAAAGTGLAEDGDRAAAGTGLAEDGNGAAAGTVPAGDGDGTAARDGSRRWALRDVDLRVEPGTLAAIVGPSGAGKTTISYLIPRLYDTTRGRVLLDDNDVRELTLASLADAIGMVTQETYLFHASVRQNLAYARPGASDDELVAAARAAYIHERIMELDDGYDTVVGERGYRLSGGEKQRLAIARVVLKDPRVLILDEATSALDTASERIVQAALQPLMHGRTTIAIAHRLSTILAADVIFVLDRGRLVERGSHAELVRGSGLYRSLFDEQFGGGTVEARCDDGLVMSNGQVIHLPERGAVSRREP
jgi:ATP-binding cassette subfamily B protein